MVLAIAVIYATPVASAIEHLHLVGCLHLPSISCLVAEEERIYDSASEINVLRNAQNDFRRFFS
jgi:hypothetical protein